MLKIIFSVISFILILFLGIYKLFLRKIPRTPEISVFVSVITGTFFFYVLSAIIYSIFAEGILNKIVLLLFGFSPFIIGKFATYEKETFYCYLQIIIISLGILFVLL